MYRWIGLDEEEKKRIELIHQWEVHLISLINYFIFIYIYGKVNRPELIFPSKMEWKILPLEVRRSPLLGKNTSDFFSAILVNHMHQNNF